MPSFANALIGLSNAQNFIKLEKLSILLISLYKDYRIICHTIPWDYNPFMHTVIRQ
jgi:hypothetical protein